MDSPQDPEQSVDQQRLLEEAELFASIEIGRLQIERGECVCLTTAEEVHDFFAEIKHGRSAREEFTARVNL